MNQDKDLLPYKEHLNDIREALSNEDAYLFIGAGFSLNAEPKTVEVQSKFKTWASFMEQLANRLWPELEKQELARKVAGNHLYIAQLYEEEFGTSAFYKELLQAVPYKDYTSSDIHRGLIGLEGWKGFITTNQDCLIEQALDQLHLYHDVIISDLDVATKPASRKVYKLHGSMERPESIIFTEEQYRTYEQNHPLLHVKIRSIFAEHCVVFVGFSLTDINFKAIYGWVKDVLQSDYQRKAYALVMEDDIDPYTKRYWEKRNIILLPIFTKQHRNNGSAFKRNLKAYINKLTHQQEKGVAVLDESILYKLLGSEEWGAKNTEELLQFINQAPQGQDPRFADSFMKFYHKHGASLEPKDLFSLFEAIYDKWLLSPFHSIDDRALIDQLINLAENIPAEGERLHHFRLEKAEGLLQIGQFEKAEQVVKEELTKEGQSKDSRNSLLYKQIIIEKYRMNFKQIASLIGQFQIDWERPDWLNRLAAVYLLLGDKSMAMNLYNRAIQVADEKRDDWNLYLANLSKSYLMNDIFDFDTYDVKEKEQVQLTVRRLFQRLKETGHPTFERWRQFEELRSEWWAEYKNWKSQLGNAQRGFNSSKRASFQQVNEMIYFYEINGLPHFTMTGKRFDVILDIFIENSERLKGTSLAIIFGHDKQLGHAYRFDFLTEIAGKDRSVLYQQSISYVENMIWYIKSLHQNSYHRYAEQWLPALIQLLSRMTPTLKDEEIDEVAIQCFQLFQEVHLRPWVDPFANAREKLLEVISRCLYFRPDVVDQKLTFNILEKSIGNSRLVNALSKLDWEGFEKESIPDDIVGRITENRDYSSAVLLDQWIEAELLSEDQKEHIFQKVYGQDEDFDELQKVKLLLLQFFKNKMENKGLQEILDYGIDQFRNRYSSSNVRVLYQLSQHADKLNDDQINLILNGVENKLKNGPSTSFFINEELASYHLYFLHKLWMTDKVKDSELIKVLSEASHLEMSATSLVAELAKEDVFTCVLTDNLLETSYSYQVQIRKTNQLIIGFWLKERTKLGEVEDRLLERLLIGLDDSHVEVASESIRAIAFMLKDNPSLLSGECLERVVQVTKRGIHRNEINYLTNLAFLYKELLKSERLPDLEKTVVNEVVINLSTSSFSNVRREVR